ncbi:hypothetical protein [Nocardioides piscis]|uniref:Uncharacterized protein n=1 Tax=Nocardioides piscis TaxID=2714938 RepID=A0A6G7YHC7_9ACTN|nr:hypothetical protein [Nocardioides piscis]QIK76038.1 hypothetical protein G7071_11940 [Nocardioides piscis]
MLVHEACIVTPRPVDRSGYLRDSDLTLDTWGPIGWQDGTPERDRRVIVDLRHVTGFGAGTAERIARVLVDAGAGSVQVEGGRRATMRSAFTATLKQACMEYERGAAR